MAGLKDSNEALAGEALTSLCGFAPPLLLALGGRLATKASQRSINTVTTNVPGPQLPLYVLGRRMLQAFPFVPLGAQMRITVAIFSYDGQVTFGVTGDYDAAPDLDVMCRGSRRAWPSCWRLLRRAGPVGAACASRQPDGSAAMPAGAGLGGRGAARRPEG